MAKKDAKSNKEKKHFFKDFKAEIKKVIWPTPKQLVNSTIAIITMVLVVAVIVFVLDVAFDMFNKYVLTGLQEAAQTISVEENDETTETTDDEGADTTEIIEDSVDTTEANSE